MATGNPRNKVALKPGFSLIGWIRLTNSGEDLIGRKRGAISSEELRKHDKFNDCWIAIRGNVYNITRYLDFHPGGVEQLMRGAGKDATNLFDEFHAWVNLEKLLAKCYIGPLKNAMTLDLSDINENNTGSMKAPTTLAPSISSSSQLSPSRQTESSSSQVPVKIIPRFDWIQKKNDLTIYFYMKSFCNPGIHIEQICDKESKVTIFIDSLFTYEFSFFKSLKWPPTLKINQETGKIEICYEKEETEIWPSYGLHERITTDSPKFCEFIIVGKKSINHDSFELMLRPKSDRIIEYISIGHHVDLKLSINGKDVMRSYTPVPARYTSFETSSAYMDFVVKRYTSGIMSKSLYEKSIAENILVSHQLGSFELNRLKFNHRVAFLAAGSGITPFCSILDHLLERNSNQVQNIVLYYFNKTEQDIWFYKLFMEMSEKDQRFKAKFILSEPDTSWTGERGKISEKILDELKIFDVVLICGPVSFNAEALRIMNLVPKVESICFQG